MFEDLARNLVVPKALGMTTVLIVPRNFKPTFSEIWERDPAFDDAVDLSPTIWPAFWAQSRQRRPPRRRPAIRRRPGTFPRQPARNVRPGRRGGSTPGG